MKRALLLLLVACSGGSSSSSDCEAIESDIREAAAKRSPPLDPNGVCNSKDAQVQKDFGPACEKLRNCK